MKTKRLEELNIIDETLDIFDESDWNFINETNIEFFEKVETDFNTRSSMETLKYSIITLLVCLVIGGLGVYTYKNYILGGVDKEIFKDVEVAVKRVDGGTQIGSEDFLEVSKVVAEYFQVLKSDKYSELNKYCLVQSTFYESEKLFRDKMEYAFDKNDCYSRALKMFSKFFSVRRVKEVYIKDNTYYAYVDIDYPDNNSLSEYFYIYSADMLKYFNTNDITDSNIVRYILQLASTFGLPTATSEVCIELEKVGGNYIIIDDSFLTTKCTGSYNYAVSQVVKQLGLNKVVEQYE